MSAGSVACTNFLMQVYHGKLVTVAMKNLLLMTMINLFEIYPAPHLKRGAGAGCTCYA